MFPWTLSLHQEYGEIVRIHPDELSVVAPAYQDIFASRPSLPKPDIGVMKPPNQAPSLVTARSIKEHDRMRHVLSHAFSERALKEQEPIIQKYVDLLIAQLLDQSIANEDGIVTLDIGEWYSFTTFDTVGDLCFGESFHSLENSRHHEWVQTIFKGIKFAVILTSLDHFSPARAVVRKCIPKSMELKAHSHSEFCRKRVDERMKHDSGRPDFISFILKNKDKHGFSREEIDSNISLLVFAGSETSASTCTSATWFLLKNPAALKRLQKEVRENFEAIGDITISTVSPLPYLDAIIQEALRLQPPGPVSLPREVDRAGVIVYGQEIPIGVSINMDTIRR